jgi:metal-responsive CopG/Arc/MetJ family transcriptional regulator
MSTTAIHVPLRLLELVDARAKALGKSRNRVILDAIEETLVPRKSWSPEFLAMLATPLDKASESALKGAGVESIAAGRPSPRRRW